MSTPRMIDLPLLFRERAEIQSDYTPKYRGRADEIAEGFNRIEMA